MNNDAFQDHYPDDLAHCYGCGRLNQHGHQLKSHWDGHETVAHFTPEPYHIAIPGYVYGGLIASLIDQGVRCFPSQNIEPPWRHLIFFGGSQYIRKSAEPLRFTS